MRGRGHSVIYTRLDNIGRTKMKNSLLWQDVVSVAGWRAVSISLALVVVLGLGVVTAKSAQAKNTANFTALMGGAGRIRLQV